MLHKHRSPIRRVWIRWGIKPRNARFPRTNRRDSELEDLGSPMAQDDAAWLAKSPALREKLIAMGVFLNHRTHRTHGNKSSHRYVIFPWFRRVPWFPALRRQERVCGRGLEELELTDRSDATSATCRRLGLAIVTWAFLCQAMRDAKDATCQTAAARISGPESAARHEWQVPCIAQLGANHV
jgi:hypothetical protein